MKWRLSAWKVTPGSIGEEDEALYLFKNVYVRACMCVHVLACSKSEDNVTGLVISFHCGSRDQTQCQIP